MVWKKSDRAKLLKRLLELDEELSGDQMMTHSDEELDGFEEEETMLFEEYAENIPYQSLSRCPFCETALKVAIDLVGLDGPWWWYACPVDLQPHDACEHFQVFLGALNFGDRNPTEVTEGVNPGPGAPFVIERLLSMETVKAVLTQFRLQTGDTAFLIAYFSEEGIDQVDLHQEWRLDSYALTDEDGEIISAESKYDPRLFELDSWIEQEKLLWIAPGDATLRLCKGLPSPLVGIEGTQWEQVIADGELELWDPPMGEESSMYDRD